MSGAIVALEMYIIPKFMQIVSNIAIISFLKKYNSVLHPIFMHLIGIFGAMSDFLIIALNAFMNYPVGIEYLDGKYIDINLYSIFFTPIEFIEVFHGILASLKI